MMKPTSKLLGSVKAGTTAKIIVYGWFVIGLSLILASFVPNLRVAPAIRHEPMMELIMGILLSIGSFLFLMSTRNWSKESTTWRLELIAHPLMISMWLFYAFLVVTFAVFSIVPFATAVSSAVACLYRMKTVTEYSKMTRANIDHLRRGEF